MMKIDFRNFSRSNLWSRQQITRNRVFQLLPIITIAVSAKFFSSPRFWKAYGQFRRMPYLPAQYSVRGAMKCTVYAILSPEEQEAKLLYSFECIRRCKLSLVHYNLHLLSGTSDSSSSLILDSLLPQKPLNHPPLFFSASVLFFFSSFCPDLIVYKPKIKTNWTKYIIYSITIFLQIIHVCVHVEHAFNWGTAAPHHKELRDLWLTRQSQKEDQGEGHVSVYLCMHRHKQALFLLWTVFSTHFTSI